MFKNTNLILFVLLLTNYVLSTPVNCKTDAQTVLSIEYMDCTEKTVCKTFCTDFIKDCPKGEQLFFEIDTKKGIYSQDAFERTCIERKFSSPSYEYIKRLEKNGKSYLKLLGKKDIDILKAIKLYTWSLQFASNILLKKGKKDLLLKSNEDFLLELKWIKGNFTKEQVDVYNLVRDSIVNQYLKKVKLYQRSGSDYQSNIHIFAKRFVKNIGRDLKLSYFGASTYDVIDRWASTIYKYKKECEIRKTKSSVQGLREFDDNLMKNNPKYPFGAKSSFNYQRDINNEDYKKLFSLRNRWFSSIASGRRNLAFCQCFDFKHYYNFKSKLLKKSNQSLDQLNKERNVKMNVIKQRCQIECNKRKLMVKKKEEMFMKKIKDMENAAKLSPQ